jgi:hypothetical protein
MFQDANHLQIEEIEDSTFNLQILNVLSHL